MSAETKSEPQLLAELVKIGHDAGYRDGLAAGKELAAKIAEEGSCKSDCGHDGCWAREDIARILRRQP